MQYFPPNSAAQDFDYYEGDIILDKDDLMVVSHKANETMLRRKKRNAIYHRYKLWASRNIPFAISSSLRKYYCHLLYVTVFRILIAASTKVKETFKKRSFLTSSFFSMSIILCVNELFEEH